MPQPPATLVPPVSQRDHVQGPASSPLVLVEYGDYECPYCGKEFPVVRGLQERFGDRLRFVFRHFPVATIHPHASMAAQVAEAAGAQGRFWPMHELLFRNQDELGDADLSHYAVRLGLELYRFQSDLSTGIFARRVEEDRQSGLDSGVVRTPTFFINGVRYDGPHVFEDMAAALQTAAARAPGEAAWEPPHDTARGDAASR